MEDIAPGSILQRIFIKQRLKKFNAKNFCEIGGGNGYIANIFLNKGLTGVGYDLNESACEKNKMLNKHFIEQQKYEVHNANFFEQTITEKFDIIISCMVIEHLPPDVVNDYFENGKKRLTPNGHMIVMVPASMLYWGIEDEIAGHFKRYEYADFEAIATQHGYKISNLSGLTYPLSNWLFSLSNKIVQKNEGYKKELSMQEQTVLSGNRENKYKSSFPKIFKLILNEVVLYPFYILQMLNLRNTKAMIIYCEMEL